jgi:ribosomal protein S10
MKKKFQLRIKSLNQESSILYKEFLILMLNKIRVPFKVIDLPTKKKRVTLLKSPHVNKSAREQFEIRYYNTIFHIVDLAGFDFLKTILKNKPKTVSISLKVL